MPKSKLSQADVSIYFATVLAVLSRQLHDVVFPPDSRETPIMRLPALNNCLDLLRAKVLEVVSAVASNRSAKADSPVQEVDDLILEWQHTLSQTIDDGFPNPQGFRSGVDNLILSLRVIAAANTATYPNMLSWWEVATLLLSGETKCRKRKASVTEIRAPDSSYTNAELAQRWKVELKPPCPFDPTSETWRLCNPSRIGELCDVVGVNFDQIIPDADPSRLCYLPADTLPERIRPIWTIVEQGIGNLESMIDLRRTSESTKKKPPSKLRRRGRPPDTDRRSDAKMAEAWMTRSYRTYVDLAAAFNVPVLEVRRALDRNRKRNPKAHRKSLE